MNAEQRRDRRQYPTIRDRVTQAYYEHGRFCAFHPPLCLSVSIVCFLFLAFPTISRFRLPVSSPMDVHWTTGSLEKENGPDWLQLAPAAYLQQIVIRAGVEPWNPNVLNAEQSVRGPISRAFSAIEKLRSVPGLSAACLHVQRPASTLPIPEKDCLLIAPTYFWNDTMEQFLEDTNVVSTVFSPPCAPSLCIRDLLLGMPAGMTGIKQRFQTNRKRNIDFGLTLFFHEYNEKVIESLRSALDHEFTRVQSAAQDESTFVHVFYRPRKYFADYFPLLFSYLVFALYLYYSASKFEMVSSRAGLALAAAFTIAATLLSTAGVSAYLDLQPSLWGAEVFPYLALILGLENILVITKAVVYTPPSLDVASRIAHGLSHEGYTLTKYFILELIFLSVGFVTGVPEIQQFCQFAFVGLVADFFMQLFFYVPCLALDLHRLGDEEKKRFSLLLLTCKVPQLGTFPAVNCPVKRLWPSLFERARKRRVKRTLSESRIDENLIEASEGNDKKKTHRRSASSLKCAFDDNGKPVQSTVSARRLRIMYFIARTRFFQRTLMVLFALWVIWLGFIVRRNLPENGANSTETSRFGVSQRLLETAPQEWGEWQRRTFKWWPVLFAEYNLTLSGHYITYLPPIVVKAAIPPNDPMLFPIKGKETNGSKETKREHVKEAPNELRSRIEWLELQLRVYMVVCLFCVLTIVILFLLYACFWGQWRNGWKFHNNASIAEELAQQHAKSKNFSESVPLKLVGHRFPVEMVFACGPRNEIIVSICQDGKVIFWDEVTGEKRQLLNRNRALPTGNSTQQDTQEPTEITDPTPNSDSTKTTTKSSPKTPIETLPSIWCANADERVLVLGCADGSIEVGSLERAKLLGVYLQSQSGVGHIKIKNDFLVLARLAGTVESLKIDYTDSEPLRIRSIRQLCQAPAHQKPITVLECASKCFITASHDHTEGMAA
ncbi:unnamed protein product, partial [Mesorhabditis belari]|uniref:Sterol regulatory element-binding protein cleavage-activating protein n=1 Tax=Mesorhabditis belari TaxID=2138241 RepID=A0AAF3F503_9BILA